MDNTKENHAIYNKPDSMTTKEFIMKRTALTSGFPHNVVKAVIDNQFRTALEALPTNNTLEIAGIGKLIYLTHKASRSVVNVERSIKSIEEAIMNEQVLDENLDDMHQEIFRKQLFVKEMKTKINLKK